MTKVKGREGPFPREGPQDATHRGIKPPNSTKDSHVYKRNEPISTAPQLDAIEGIRYILLKDDENKKTPLEKDWNKTANYGPERGKIRGWVKGGNNYGIATGFGGAHCFDADELAILKEMGVMDRLPKTFVVTTGGGGEHWWYIIEGMQKKLIMYHPTLKDKKNPADPLHLGEVQSHNNYAVGPGCLHKSGKRYTVKDPSPVATLEYETLLQILTECGIAFRKKEPKPLVFHEHDDEFDVRLVDIAMPDNPKERAGANGREIFGGHPVHGSKSGTNFSINVDKNIWICWKHHKSGGGWKEFLAVKEGIISCAEAGPRCLQGEKYIQVMDRAEELGLIDNRRHELETIEVGGEVIIEREKVQELPINCPDDACTVIKAPPRSGKTHTVVRWMRNRGEGNYITHRHAIIAHAVKIFKELGGRRAVWIEGKKQKGMCRFPGMRCKDCALHPKDFKSYEEMKSVARQLLQENAVLEKSVVPPGRCPYYVLKFADFYADFTFTVVNNVPVKGKTGVRARKMVIFDEDPAISHFYTESIEIAKMKKRKGEVHVKNELIILDKALQAILERRKKPTLRPYAEKIKELRDIIEAKGEEGVESLSRELTRALEGWTPKRRYVREEAGPDEITLEKMVNVMGNLYKKCPIGLVRGHGGYTRVFLIGDARKPMINEDWWADVEKTVIIGATISEMFGKERNGKVLEVPTFRYAERFILLVIDADKGTKDKNIHQQQRKKCLTIARLVAGDGEGLRRRPLMVLCGSKEVQRQVVDSIGGNAHGSTTERETGQKWNFLAGGANVFFQNSVISRGLDIEQYNCLIAYDTNFAQPFWQLEDQKIANAIVSDETTNSVLRISPTPRKDTKTTKIIIIPKRDLWKVRYLDGRIVETDRPATEIAETIKKKGITGLVEMEEDSIKVSKVGMESEGAKEKVIQGIRTGSEFSEEAILTAVDVVSRAMQKREVWKKWLSVKNIFEMTHIDKELIRSALADLYYQSKVETRNTASGARWRYAIHLNDHFSHTNRRHIGMSTAIDVGGDSD